MFQFFRKNRKDHSDNSQILRYLKYAVGEIVLVVLGILIAIQVNNWNESNINRNQEKEILSNIKQDIIRDTIDILEMVEMYRSFIKEESLLLDFLYSSDPAPLIPIDYNLALSTPTVAILHQSSFNNLQNNEPALLTNNTIRKKITRHYDYFVKRVILAENELTSYNAYSMKLPYFLRYFKAVNNQKIMVNSDKNSEEYTQPDIIRKELQIRDIDGLKKDEEFKIILSESLASSDAKVQIYTDFIEQTRELIKAIDLEIEQLSK